MPGGWGGCFGRLVWAANIRANGTCQERLGHIGGREGPMIHSSTLSIGRIIRRKVNPHGPGAIRVDGMQVGSDLVPNGADHIPLSPSSSLG